MRSIKFLVLLFLSMMGTPISGQQPVTISLSEVMDRVKAGNIALKISDKTLKQSQADYKQTEAAFLPQVSVAYSGFTTNNPLMAFGARLNQAVLTQNDFNPDLINNPDNTSNFATRLEVQQLVFSPGRNLQREVAKARLEAVKLQNSRTQEYLVFEVEVAYMKLQLAHEALDVLEQTLKAALANKKLAKDNYEQGYLQRADVLAVEVRVTEVENQLQSARSQVQNASDQLAFLMSEPVRTTYLPTDSLLLTSPDLNQLEVSENRADIRAMQLTADARGGLVKAAKSAYLPRLEAFGRYELFDDGLFQGSANGYTLGASLNWSLFEGNQRQANLSKSQAAYDQAKLEYKQYLSQSRLEFNQARRALQDAENKLRLIQLAMAQSQESLRIRTDRFKEGLENTSDLLLAEAKYAQMRLEHFQAVFEHNYAQAYLSFLTHE